MLRLYSLLLTVLLWSLLSNGQETLERPKVDPKERPNIQKTIDQHTSSKDYNALGEACFQMALSYSDEDRTEMPIRYDYLEKSLDAWRKANNKRKEADFLKYLGEMNMMIGNMNEGIFQLQQSLGIYKEIKYDTIQEVYSLIGVAHTQIGNHNDALRYGLEAVKTAERLKDQTRSIGTVYNYIAVTYDHLGEYEQTKNYLLKAMAISEKFKDIPLIYMLGTNIATINVRLKKPQEGLEFLKELVKKYPVPDEIYMKLAVTSRFLYLYLQFSDFKNAEPYCKELVELCKQIPPDDPEQVTPYPSIIAYFTETRQYDKALPYISLLKDICAKYGLIDRLGETYKQAYRVDSARGDLASAIINYKLYKVYNDSSLSVSKTREVNQLNVQYETEKKNRDIEVLKKEGELQQGVLDKTRLTRNLMIVAVVLLLIIVGLLFNRYRLKQKSNHKINEQNNSLQRLVKEKEWLLKEVHHRVKNNLHTIIGLLESQAAYLRSDEAVKAIRDSQHRVSAMSLIHQKLYRTESFSVTNMRNYIHELALYFNDTINTGAKINFIIDVDNVDFDLSYSVPVGLILNEAITNSIKYAFPGKEKETITISMKHVSGEEYLLVIADNGKGLPPGFDPQKSHSLGMSLMNGLSEDIRGGFAISNNNGTEIRIRFIYKEPYQSL